MAVPSTAKKATPGTGAKAAGKPSTGGSTKKVTAPTSRKPKTAGTAPMLHGSMNFGTTLGAMTPGVPKTKGKAKSAKTTTVSVAGKKNLRQNFSNDTDAGMKKGM